MKRDLFLGALLIGLAAIGIGGVALLPMFVETGLTKTVKPKTEVFAVLKKPEPPIVAPPIKKVKKETPPIEKKAVEPVKPLEVAEPIVMPKEKTTVVEKKKEVPPVVVKKKDDEKKPNPKVIVLEPNIKLNDPDGEYTLKVIDAGKEVILLGVIKTLKIAGANNRARIDATRLDAKHIEFVGSINSGAKVLLGNARTLRIAGVNGGSLLDASKMESETVTIVGDLNASKVLLGTARILRIGSVNNDSLLDASKTNAQEVLIAGNLNHSKVILGRAQKVTINHVNDRSTLDGSKLNADSIKIKAAINGRSVVKLDAPNGNIEFAGPVNDRSEIEINASGGKVVFNVRGGAIITGNAKLKLNAKDIHLQGQIHGNQTQLNVTLSKEGFLAFERLNNGVRLHYRKANAADPEPRVNKGQIDAKAELRKLDAAIRDAC